jgi:hypothetical protein
MTPCLANDVVPLPTRSEEQRVLVERCRELSPGGTTCAVVPPEGLEFYEPGSSAPRRTG